MGLVPPKSENLPNFNGKIYSPFCYLMPFQNELSQRPGIGLKLKVIYHTSKILPLAITFGHTICIHGKKVCLVGKKLDQLDVNKHLLLILNP